jgi:hypothetical protein
VPCIMFNAVTDTMCYSAGECGGRADVDWMLLPLGESTALVAAAVGEPLQMNVSRCDPAMCFWEHELMCEACPFCRNRTWLEHAPEFDQFAFDVDADCCRQVQHRGAGGCQARLRIAAGQLCACAPGPSPHGCGRRRQLDPIGA